MLWRHPNLLSGDYTLFWYESETDQVPKGHQVLPVGMYQVNIPKKRRKGYDFCFRIDLEGTDDAEGRKFILAAKSDDTEGDKKLKMWKDALKKIETDSKAELAAAKLKANLATARAAGRAASAFGGDTVRPLGCVVPLSLLLICVAFVRTSRCVQKAEDQAEQAAAEREMQLQDNITAGIIEAGILNCVMATPVSVVSHVHSQCPAPATRASFVARAEMSPMYGMVQRLLLWCPLLCAPAGCARKARATRPSKEDFLYYGAPRRHCSERETAWRASQMPPQTTTCWSTTKALVSFLAIARVALESPLTALSPSLVCKRILNVV